jgi:hypothetical protein
MEKERLIQLLDLAEKHAYMILVERQVPLVPSWVLISDKGEVTALGIPWDDNFEKTMTKLFLPLEMAKHKTIAYSVVLEVWAASLSQEEYERGPEELVPPSERPDRRELVLAMATDGTSTEWRGWNIVRDALQMVSALEPTKEDFGGVETWMTKLLN